MRYLHTEETAGSVLQVNYLHKKLAMFSIRRVFQMLAVTAASKCHLQRDYLEPSSSVDATARNLRL